MNTPSFISDSDDDLMITHVEPRKDPSMLRAVRHSRTVTLSSRSTSRSSYSEDDGSSMDYTSDYTPLCETSSKDTVKRKYSTGDENFPFDKRRKKKQLGEGSLEQTTSSQSELDSPHPQYSSQLSQSPLENDNALNDVFSSPTHKSTSCIGVPYNQDSLSVLKLIMPSITKPSTLISDFFDILSINANRGYYIPSKLLFKIIDKALHWSDNILCQRLFLILMLDFRLRPVLDKSRVKELLHTCLEALVRSARESSLLEVSCERLSLVAVEPTLSYITMALQSGLPVQVDSEQHLAEKVLKWNTLQKVLKALFKIIKNEFQEMSNIVDQLMTILCLPLCLPQRANTQPLMKTVALQFSQKLANITSNTQKQTILHQIPSVHLKQNIIDCYLESQFKLMLSTGQLNAVESYRRNEMSLHKYCCVHLCRMPYHHNGDPCSLAFFLNLLLALLQSHVKLLMGVPWAQITSQPSSHTTHLSDELSHCLASVKPHMNILIDRLTEDQSLLTALMEEDCWSSLRGLMRMTQLDRL